MLLPPIRPRANDGRHTVGAAKDKRYPSAMDAVGLGARVLLALVFTVAAVGKLADQPGTRAALKDFGLSHRLHVALAPALPIAEFLTATALLIQPTARWGAVAALALLAVFAGGIIAAMRRGEAPDCHCFGQLHSAPAGRGTLIRNALLAAPAVLVVAHGAGTHLRSWLPTGSAVDVVGLLGLVALGAYAIQLHLQSERLRRDFLRVREATKEFPAGPPIGAPAPRFSKTDLLGHTMDLDQLLRTGRPVAMVFVSPDCGPCELLLEQIGQWQRGLADRMTIVIASRATAREVRTMAETYQLQNVIFDQDSELFDLYRATTTPSAVIVRSDGRVGTALHSTMPIVEALIRRTLSELEHRPRPVEADEVGLRVSHWAASPGS